MVQTYLSGDSAVNIAASLARDGAKVGLLDADVYGPSIPLMMGTSAKPIMQENKIVPLEAHGLPTPSAPPLVHAQGEDLEVEVWMPAVV